MTYYCRTCASTSHRVLFHSDKTPPHGCSFGHPKSAWSRRRWICSHCEGARYPAPDYMQCDEEPTTNCIRGHAPRWREDPDSAWAIGGVANRIVRPEPATVVLS